MPLILRIFSCRTQNSAYAYHLHFCWRTAYQGSAYRIPSKKVGIRRTEKGGYSLVVLHIIIMMVSATVKNQNILKFMKKCRFDTSPRILPFQLTWLKAHLRAKRKGILSRPSAVVAHRLCTDFNHLLQSKT